MKECSPLHMLMPVSLITGSMRYDPGVRMPLEIDLQRLGYSSDISVFAEFLKMMLRLDPAERASLDEIMGHPWLADA